MRASKRTILFSLALAAVQTAAVSSYGQDEAPEVFKAIGRAVQVLQVQDGAQAVPAEEAKPAEEKKPEEEEIIVPTVQAYVYKPNEIRFQLHDGSVLTGELSVNSIIMSTDFGDLEIPISRIVSMKPGLQSYPEVQAKLQELVEKLGGDDYEQREAAQKELVGYGAKITRFLNSLTDDGNSERQRRLGLVRKSIEELQEGMEEEEGGKEEVWIPGDTITTDTFTVVGRIKSDEFKMASKYGALTVGLGDIALGTREISTREIIRKSLDVNAANFMQRQPANTKIKVKRGDKITITVEGSFNLAPWSQECGPDGNAQFGTYLGKFALGSVIAKIGDNTMEQVGASKTFVAKSSGTLTLGIAMMDNFVNSGYDWGGGYKVKVKVEPQ